MPSKFHKKAIARITPEARALMVKSLEILSQVHDILDRHNISQKQLAAMLDISQPAVSKMLSPGGNLEINTIIKLELLLCETILTTPQKNANTVRKHLLSGSLHCGPNYDFREVTYTRAEASFGRISVN